ncbi:hypothetical protein [Sphingomonas aerophila]|uniref:Uncharacterized protein n=1 Tax=Sphingomonas aerophila TaxID=1344948 RepID=A0A7W9ETT2_9SPHN|nr:hypothetical protein [Sphingomonas aerophila]MBB5714455.1 hypothetical protein [Sphingomonas aerophila]
MTRNGDRILRRPLLVGVAFVATVLHVLRVRDPGPSALIYFGAQRRVAESLSANRGSVGALFGR